VVAEPLKVGERVVVSLTYEDYAALPNDGRRYELLEGDIDVTPAPSMGHQRSSRNLERILLDHVRRHKLGAIYDAPVDMILDARTVAQPDILFVAKDRLGIISPRGVEGAADLVVEILSPATRRVDRTTKMRVYAKAGVLEYWIVDPEAKTFELFGLRQGAYVLLATAAGDETIRPDFFAGLEISLTEVFADD